MQPRGQERASARWRLPLRLHILLSFLLLIVALVLILGPSTGCISQDLVDSSVSASFGGASELAVQDLRRLQETARAAAEAVAANPLAGLRDREARERHLYALATVLRAVPGISAAYVGWPDGDFLLLRPIAGLPDTSSPPAGAAWLAQWAGSAGARYDFLTPDLEPLEVRDRGDIVFDPRSRPWFVEAASVAETIVTRPYIFFTTREPGISAARQAASGAVAGVDVSLWDLSRRLPRGRPGPSTVAAIVDVAGGVVAYNDLGRLRLLLARQSGSDGLPAVGDLASPVLEPLVERWLASREPFVEALIVDGHEWLATAAPLGAAGIALVMATPTGEIAAAADTLRLRLLQLLGLALLFALAISWYAARSLSRPVEALAREVGQVGRLDFSAPRRRPSRVAELADLESALVSMRASLSGFAALYRGIAEEEEPEAMLERILAVLRDRGIAEAGVAWLADSGGALRLVARHAPGGESGNALGSEALAAGILASSQPLFRGSPAGERDCLGVALRLPSGEAIGALAIVPATAGAEDVPQTEALLGFVGQTLSLVLDRRRLLAERASARRETAQILNSIGDGLCVLDGRGRLRSQNPAAEAILGWREEELRGRDFLELVLEAPAEREGPSPVEVALRGGRTRRITGAVFRSRDASPVTVEFECSPLRDEDGGIEGVVLSFRDVSVEREAIERAGELQRRLERLVDQAKVGILVHRNFVPILANRELAQMLGYDSPEEILAMADCRRLFAEHERERIARYNAERLGGGPAPLLYQLEGRRRDGSTIVMDNRAFTIEWDEQTAVCAMLTDITAQLATEEQLRQSQRLEAVGRLTGGIAHDFNNLLTIILGNAEELAARLSREPRLRDLAETTARAAERGAELTGRLLAFGRRQPLDPRPTDVAGQLAGMEALLRRSLGEQVELELRCPPGTSRAMVDAGQLENAVLNLCLNARDAMPEGGRLRIETADLEVAPGATGQDGPEPGRYVTIAVSDTGTGMDKETLARIFEPFFTTKEVGRGSGLGLSMVYGFVKQSKGHVRAVSELGEGTTVTLYLPRAEQELKAPAQPAGAAASMTGHERILLVEDDDLVRGHVTALLAGLGYDVVAVRNGRDALAALEDDGLFDLLFTDMVIPGGMSGRQLAAEVQARRPDLPVLFTSGYVGGELGPNASVEHGFHLLPKPYRRSELAAKIRSVLDEAGG